MTTKPAAFGQDTRTDHLQSMTTKIAVVGLAGRYPKAPDLETLWSNLVSGLDAVGEATGDRWDLGHMVPGSNDPHRVYTRASGLLDRIDLFDAEFFGMSPREAKQVDPQHRLMLELAWEALESGGIVPARVAGSTSGVYVGISANDYANLTLVDESPDAYTNIGSAISIAANRISYIFDLRGPSMSIDTACSSSMVAIHQACRALAGGEIAMALAGGVNILVSPKPYVGFSRASMLSPDGRCKSFDASGNGYVRAEGGGMLVLKRLEDAERDGDPIIAVIRATGVNSDGRTMGLALPNGDAQERLLKAVYSASGTAPEDVFYVEAHGTGTAAGDPIECGAIGRVLGAPRSDGSICRMGSIKSNIGHLESGAGIAGITKVLLSIRNRAIPGNLHFNEPNPKILFDEWKLGVVDSLTPLPASERPLVFGINSFGFGGTNGHMILEEYRPSAPAAEAEPTHPENDWGRFLVISGHNQAALEATADAWIAQLDGVDEAQWPALRAAALHLRTLHPLRLSVVADTAAQARAELIAWRAGEPANVVLRKTSNAVAAGSQKTAFVFSGNGPQWWGMGRELLAECPPFRAAIEEVDAVFRPLAGWSLVERMSLPEDDVQIALTEVAQPLLFAQQVALVKVLAEAGISPDVVFGHSVGEAAAAWASGALSLEQATQVIFHRSQQQATTRGAGKMAAVGMSQAETEAVIAQLGLSVEVAAINSPKAVTVAGPEHELEQLVAHIDAQGQFVRLLALDYAFHTRYMDPIRDPLLAALAGLEAGQVRVPMVSTVTGETLAGPELGTAYWWDNIRQPVAFDAGVRCAIEEHGATCFVEVGPHPVLKDYVLQVAKAAGNGTVQALTTLRRPSSKQAAPEMPTLRAAIAEIFGAGAGAPAAILPEPERTKKIPGVQWQRQRHWRGACELPDVSVACSRDHMLLGARAPGADHVWNNAVQTTLVPHLLDHVVQDSAIFPAAGYIEMLLAAGKQRNPDAIACLESVEIQRPLVVAADLEPIVQTSLDDADGMIAVRSRPDRWSGDWTVHCKGRITSGDGVESFVLPLDDLRAAMPVIVDEAAHYGECGRRGMNYGPTFKGVREVRLVPLDAPQRQALGHIKLDWIDEAEQAANHAHPSVIDGALQVLITLIAQGDARPCSTIPVFIDRVVLLDQVPSEVYCHVRLIRESPRSGVADFEICAPDGRVVMRMLGGRFQKVEFNPLALSLLAEDWRVDPEWQPREAAALELPAVADLVSAAGVALPQADPAVAEGLDRLAATYAAEAIATLADGEDSFTVASLSLAAGLPEESRPLLRSLFAIAEGAGLLLRDEGSGRYSLAEAPLVASGDLLRQMMLAHPGWVAELVALSAAGAQLHQRLVEGSEGKPVLPMTELIEDGAPSRRHANRALAQLVGAIVAAWPQGRPIRVLETHGSTGGLAATVLPMLPPERSDYLFTDPDEGRVAKAEHRLGRHHNFRAQVYDPGSIPQGAFDLLVTADFALAQAHAEHLVPGGMIIALHPCPGAAHTLLQGPVDAHLGDGSGGIDGLERVIDSTGPLGCELIVARRNGAVVPEQQPLEDDGLRRTLLVSETEADTPFVRAVCDALAAVGGEVRLRTLTAADCSDDGMSALVAEQDADEYVHLAGWNNHADLGDPATFRAYQDLRCYSIALLAKAVEQHAVDHPARGPVRLRVVTRGAFATMTAGPIDPFQATAAGLARVLANELAGLKARTIDVHATADDAEAGADLARALLSTGDEAETQLVGGQRFVSRVRETRHDEIAAIVGSKAAPEAFRLDCKAQGGLDSLHLAPAARKAPADNEVEVRVGAAGLNFRDVLWAMGMLPEEAVEHGFSGATIGMECAGVVERVGKDVTHVRPGDRVMGFASSTFGSHVTARADGMGLLPEGLTFEEGATIPTTFITAWYALDHLARLRKGEVVLIHGAAGGVGLAALQIAKHKGAIVIATAGAAEKQRLVRDMGADFVFSSRSLAFAEQVMEATGGKGVDVVLNSLAGEAIQRGLALLKPFGRFLEIGKRDLYANSRIGLRPFRQNLSYFGIDADTLLVERPELAVELFAEISELFASGVLRPLPHQCFPLARASEAFRLMQASRHVGKIVIAIPDEADPLRPVVADTSGGVSTAGTWVVTGGLAGFGLSTAQWLVENGVRSLALMGRRGAATEEAQAALAAFAEAGVTVLPLAVDVADRNALAAALDEVRCKLPPICGVIHAAAVIEDAPVVMIQPELVEKVQSAKMLGAWHLHQLTQGDPIEAFVLYSSSAGLVGNPGQGIYVGANLFLDMLARQRRAAGLPALSVGWGAISGAGFLTRNAHVEDMLASRAGMAATPYRMALAELGRLLAVGACQVSASQFNVMRLGQSLPATRLPRFRKFVPPGINVNGDGADSMAAALEVMSETERSEALFSLVRELIAKVIGAAPSQIEADRTLAELGLDSLMAVELAELLEQQVGKPVSVMQMIQAGTLNGVVGVVLRAFGSAAAPAPTAAEAGAATAASAVADAA